MQPIIKYAIVRLSSMGDILHTSPLIRSIKNFHAAQREQTEITWIVEERFYSVVEHFNEVDKIIAIPLPRRFNLQTGWKFLKTLCDRTLWKTLRTDHYDVILDPQGLLKSALIAFLMKSRLRIGFDATNSRELSHLFYHVKVRTYHENIIDKNLDLLTPLTLTPPKIHDKIHNDVIKRKDTHKAQPPPHHSSPTLLSTSEHQRTTPTVLPKNNYLHTSHDTAYRHHVQSHPQSHSQSHPQSQSFKNFTDATTQKSLKTTPCPAPLSISSPLLTISLDAQAQKNIEKFLTEHQVPHPVIIAPWSTFYTRDMGPELLSSVIKILYKHYRTPSLMITDEKHRALAEQTHHSYSTETILPPILSLKELFAIIAYAKLMVTIDSGPAYIAELIGTPTITLFGPTQRTRQSPSYAKVLQEYHNHNDIRKEQKSQFLKTTALPSNTPNPIIFKTGRTQALLADYDCPITKPEPITTSYRCLNKNCTNNILCMKHYTKRDLLTALRKLETD
ncbi:hypothetical protein COTS27_00564 [Spirochaetota bacterium]|nr:hypothetical protein COTS27_00564 [Spirochaetota bacterium]